MTARLPRRRQVVFVGEKIRQLRKDRGLTQAVLAQRIGVQQSDLCRMENGEYKVALDTLFRILAVFGIGIGEFFRDDADEASPVRQEQDLLHHFRRLGTDARQDVLDYIRFKSARESETASS